MQHSSAFAGLAFALAVIFSSCSMAAEKSAVNTTTKQKLVSQGSKSTNAGSNAVGSRATTIMPLTVQECKGLGGKVASTALCRRSNQKSCVVVDKDGTIRSNCIDEVAE